PQELGLAAEALALPLPRLAHPPFDVAVFLRRNGEEGDAPGEPIERPAVEEPHRRSQHRRDLGVVAAGVRRAGLGIGLGMPRHDQRVQLPEDRECRPGARPPLGVGADARQRESGARRQAQLPERFLDQPRRLDFLEAELGVAPDLLTEPDDLRAAPVDRLPHLPLQLVLGHGHSFFISSPRTAPPDILLPRNGLRCILGGMDYHHVLEAAGVVVFGLVFYSYTLRWFHPKGRLDARWRPVLTGLAFGVLAVVLMISRIRVYADLFIDARVLPIALITLIEGWWAGLLAAR